MPRSLPRRIEIRLHRVDSRWYLTGVPVARSWYANLQADDARLRDTFGQHSQGK
jgi:hypothetical protein